MTGRSRSSLADTIKQAVAATGKSVNAVAIQSGVAQGVLQRFVSGKRGITLGTAERLCAHLQLELRPSLKDGSS
jgi:plasmid maintenance system antidote protein VapI